MPATQKARLVVWVGRDDASTIKRAAHLRRLDLSSYARMVLFAAARADLASAPATPASPGVPAATPSTPGAPSIPSAPGASVQRSENQRSEARWRTG